jgi:DNA polymerase (family 10)
LFGVTKPKPVDNAAIAEQLETFAILLDLAGASPYSARAYRRAADLIRTTKAPVADLVRAGRARALRGIGPSIEARLVELVETGRLAELEELKRSVSPEVVGFGRYLGLGSKRALEIARALNVSTADDFRAAIVHGRLRQVRGVGPQTEKRIRDALDRPAQRGGRGFTPLLNRSRTLLERIARVLDGQPAGDPRRFVDAPEHLAVVCAAEAADNVIDAFAQLPDIVALAEREARRALGVTVEGVAVELIVAEPRRFGTELVRATGSRTYVERLEPLPDAASEGALYERLGRPYCPPELREVGVAGEPPALVELADLRGDLHCHTTWSDGRATVREMAIAARERGHEYLAICDHSPSVRVVPGVTADDLRRQAEEIAGVNEELAPFRVLRGIECDVLGDGALDLPDGVLAELDWVTASVHAGQRQPASELTKRVTEAMRHPAVRALSHPTGRLINHRPPNALDVEETISVALETGVALEVNGLPDRLDLKDEHVRLAVEAGARIVINTDAHSTTGLANIELALGTARRGGATAADVVNTRGLEELLEQRGG